MQYGGGECRIVNVTNQVNQPTLSSTSGFIYEGTTVTFASTTGGAIFRYTTDGSSPTCSTGTIYPSYDVILNVTLKVVACLNGKTDSAIRSASYVVVPNGTAVITSAYLDGSTFPTYHATGQDSIRVDWVGPTGFNANVRVYDGTNCTGSSSTYTDENSTYDYLPTTPGVFLLNVGWMGYGLAYPGTYSVEMLNMGGTIISPCYNL